MNEAEARVLLGYGYPENTPLRVFPDGRIAWIHRLMFTHAICVATPDTIRIGYDDRWCFTEKSLAEHALKTWEGAEPTGWIRNPKTGRRRPDGDATKEYISI